MLIEANCLQEGSSGRDRTFYYELDHGLELVVESHYWYPGGACHYSRTYVQHFLGGGAPFEGGEITLYEWGRMSEA